MPFIFGGVWCIRNWRQSAATAVLLWLIVLLGPTILAADAPHFLRAAGVLPALVLLPAVGLDRLWQWPRLTATTATLLIGGLLAGSLLWTIHDYRAYARSPQVAFAFESAATGLAEQLQSAPEGTAVVLLMSVSGPPGPLFLTLSPMMIACSAIILADCLSKSRQRAAIYAWPYEPLDFIPGRRRPR